MLVIDVDDVFSHSAIDRKKPHAFAAAATAAAATTARDQ